MRRGDNETVRVALEWKPRGKQPKGRPLGFRSPIGKGGLRGLKNI